MCLKPVSHRRRRSSRVLAVSSCYSSSGSWTSCSWRTVHCRSRTGPIGNSSGCRRCRLWKKRQNMITRAGDAESLIRVSRWNARSLVFFKDRMSKSCRCTDRGQNRNPWYKEKLLQSFVSFAGGAAACELNSQVYRILQGFLASRSFTNATKQTVRVYATTEQRTISLRTNISKK